MRRCPLTLVLLAALTLAQLGACRAQIRNGDQIARDPFLVLSDAARAEIPPAELLPALAAPQNAGDFNDRGVTLARLQRLDEAERDLRAADAQTPAEPRAALNLARLHVLVRESDGARAVYGALVTRSALADGTLLELGRQLAADGRSLEAVLFFECLVEKKRQTRAAALWLAAEAMDRADYGRAAVFYETVLAEQPQDAAGLFGQGAIAYLAGAWPRAAVFLEGARRNGSDEPHLPLFLTRSLIELEKYDEALAVASAARQPERELLALHGEILLVLDYRADLTPVLERARTPADREALLRRWYGDSDLRDQSDIRREFESLY